jgi:predicted outer membrane protein
MATVTLSLALGTPLLAQTSQEPAPQIDTKALTVNDKAFLNYAAEDNQAEITACLLAEKKAGSPAVKAFARLMVDDHVQIESRLAALSNSLNFDLPDGNGDEGQQTISKLEKLRGAEFELEFMAQQTKDHGDDLEKFGREQSSTKSELLHQYVSRHILFCSGISRWPKPYRVSLRPTQIGSVMRLRRLRKSVSDGRHEPGYPQGGGEIRLVVAARNSLSPRCPTNRPSESPIGQNRDPRPRIFWRGDCLVQAGFEPAAVFAELTKVTALIKSFQSGVRR